MRLPLLMSIGLTISSLSMQAQLKYPSTTKDATSYNLHGNTIKDEYMWLENDTAAKTKAWVREQNKFTNDYLNKIPYRNAFVKRITELMNYEKLGVPSIEGDYQVYFKNDGLQNQSVLYTKNPLGFEEVLADPNTLSKSGTVSIGATAFSANQKYFAYAISSAGSDWQDIYIMDMSTRTLINEKISNVKFTSINFIGDEGFYYAGYDAPKNEKTKYSAKTEYQKVFFHKIGTAQKEDAVVYEDKAHPLRYVSPQLTEDERFLILNIAEGTDGSEIKYIDLLNDKKQVHTLIEGFKTNAYVVDNIGDRLLLVTNDAAPNNKLVYVDIKNKERDNWKTVIANDNNQKLETVSIVDNKLFVKYLNKASNQIKSFDLSGRLINDIELPGIGSIGGFSGNKEDTTIYYSFSSYNYPNTIFKYNTNTKKSQVHFEPKVKFNPEEYDVRQVFYPSKDGVMVSMFVVYKRGLIFNGENPTLLYGYGGFNISMTPSFSPSLIPFLEKGGVYCVANLRGGGEYGEDWHKDGMLDKKQNVFNDFISAAEYLIQNKITNSKKLAIRGGSNGGLLVGAAMTQRPDLFKVAIPQVGVLDMLRFHKFTVGWGWVVEYGNADNANDYPYLIKYSPYHNLKKECYPATMITTGDHDDRVVPAHSFKFAARLQENQNCDQPTLIRIDMNAGHGAGKPTSKVIEEQADIFSFIFYNMGYKF